MTDVYDARLAYDAARFALDWAQGLFFMAEDAGLPAQQMTTIEDAYARFDRAFDEAREELGWYEAQASRSQE